MTFNRSPRNDSYGSRGRDDRPRFNDRGGGGRSFGGGRGSGELTLHDATCAKCGIETKVPFRPTGEKPVYCRDCFNSNDGGAPKRGPSGAPAPTVSAEDIRLINEKLDKIIQALNIE